jgi:hypothetical protein
MANIAISPGLIALPFFKEMPDTHRRAKASMGLDISYFITSEFLGFGRQN